MGVGEPGVLGGEDDVPSERQFQRAGVAVPVHRRDHWLRQASQPLDDPGLEVRPRQPLAGGDVAQIVTGGKAAAGAAHDDQAGGLGFPLQPLDLGVQRPKQVHVQRVQLLRPVEGERRRAVPVLADDQFVHWRSPLFRLAAIGQRRRAPVQTA